RASFVCTCYLCGNFKQFEQVEALNCMIGEIDDNAHRNGVLLRVWLRGVGRRPLTGEPKRRRLRLRGCGEAPCQQQKCRSSAHCLHLNSRWHHIGSGKATQWFALSARALATSVRAPRCGHQADINGINLLAAKTLGLTIPPALLAHWPKADIGGLLNSDFMRGF